MIPNYPTNTAVVCHDAGAANIIIYGLLKTGRSDWHAYMTGPAEKIWISVFPDIALYDSLDSVLEGVELLLTGTGWASDIEYDARSLAIANNIRTIAVIDHWVNYLERFVRNGKMVWPDEFWLTDDYAMTIAENIFPAEKIYKVANYYLTNQLENIGQKQELSSSPELLYVLEPVRSNWGKETQGEFQALDYFIACFPLLNLPVETVICLRLHPSEALDKYDDWVAAHPSFNMKIDDSINITEALKRASWVVGCESFALVLALMAGRKVYCTLPPWAPNCRLPHRELINLGDIAK